MLADLFSSRVFAGVFYCVVSNDLPSRRFAGPTALKPPAAITRSARSRVLLRYAGTVAFKPLVSGERQLQSPEGISAAATVYYSGG